jgi:signal transduction histidine kinase
MANREGYGEHHLVWLRWALIASLAYMVLLREGANPESAELGYVALLLASNLAIPRIPYRSSQAFGSVVLAVDTVFILIGLLLFAAPSQDLLVAYFLCILMATFGDSERRIAGAALLVSGVYGLWLLQNWADWTRASVLLRLPFLFVTTVFYGFMMQRVRAEHAARREAEARIRGLDGLLQITRSFSSSLVSQEILDQVADTIRRTLGVERCRIQLVGGQGGGSYDSRVVQALERRAPVLGEEPAGPGRSCSVLALPIVHGSEPLGVLLVEAVRQGRVFQREEIEFCQVIAHAAASALKNARQYETLVELERAKSEFLSNLSHELRTPLSAILGYAEVARESLGEKNFRELEEFLVRIRTNAEELQRHVENLLQLSQLTLGRERKHLQRVDLPALLERAFENLERLAARREVELRLDVDPSLGPVIVDGDKLERILQQLLANAVKFTERGAIQLSAALAEGEPPAPLSEPPKPWERMLRLAIQDTGPGVPAADFERIFREFQQGDGSATRRYPGLGVGLAICRRLAEILGGTIRVQSRPGQGTCFELWVPIQPLPAETA